MTDAKTTTSNKAILLFLLWALLLSFEYFIFGPNSYVKVHDNADVTLALKLAHSRWGTGWIDTWDPHMLGGTDALTEVGALDFLNIFFEFLPGWFAYGTVIFLQRFVAGFFTFLLLMKQFNVKPRFAIIPSLVYSMFSQPSINLQFDGFTLYDSLGLPAVHAGR